MESNPCAAWCWVDGVFAPKLSETSVLEKGLRIRPLREVPRSRRQRAVGDQLLTSDNSNPMIALNSAMATDGLVIEVADGTVLTQPLHIVHVASGLPAAIYTRSLLHLGKDAGATLVESYIAADGGKAYQTHDGLIVSIGNNTRLDHVRLVEEAVTPSMSRPPS